MKVLRRLALTACTLVVCSMLSTAVLAHHGRAGYGSADTVTTMKGVVTFFPAHPTAETRLVTKSRQGAAYTAPSEGIGSVVRGRLNAESVVNGTPKVLFASKVTLGCLDRHVTQQKLNLIQLTAG